MYLARLSSILCAIRSGNYYIPVIFYIFYERQCIRIEDLRLIKNHVHVLQKKIMHFFT